jgi:hypothetical protein
MFASVMPVSQFGRYLRRTSHDQSGMVFYSWAAPGQLGFKNHCFLLLWAPAPAALAAGKDFNMTTDSFGFWFECKHYSNLFPVCKVSGPIGGNFKMVAHNKKGLHRKVQPLDFSWLRDQDSNLG